MSRRRGEATRRRGVATRRGRVAWAAVAAPPPVGSPAHGRAPQGRARARLAAREEHELHGDSGAVDLRLVHEVDGLLRLRASLELHEGVALRQARPRLRGEVHGEDLAEVREDLRRIASQVTMRRRERQVPRAAARSAAPHLLDVLARHVACQVPHVELGRALGLLLPGWLGTPRPPPSPAAGAGCQRSPPRHQHRHHYICAIAGTHLDGLRESARGGLRESRRRGGLRVVDRLRAGRAPGDLLRDTSRGERDREALRVRLRVLPRLGDRDARGSELPLRARLSSPSCLSDGRNGLL